MPRSFVPFVLFKMQMVKDESKWYRTLGNALRNSPYLKLQRNGHEQCVLLIQAQDRVPSYAKKGHLLGGQGHGICSFTHPGLRFLPSSCFPGLLFLTLCSVLPVILVASRCPACILLAGPKLPPGCKATGVLSPQLSWGRHVCDLPLRAAPNRPSWCYGPLDTSLLERKGSSGLQVFFK